MEKVILSLLFPTASSLPTAMFLIIAYVVGAALASALAIRTFRSTFALGRTPVWALPNWTRLWPRTRTPLPIASTPAQGKTPTVATSKKLAMELLPTTGLPPYPQTTSTPPPIAQLVDLGPPHTPPPSELARSGHLFTYHESSRPSSPSPNRSSSPILRPQSVIYPSIRRSPSPQALLATSPPRNHKRARSLGGVVVRRTSGGYSGLRNQVDLEMQELLPSHTRGVSQDRLLIDFLPSDNTFKLASLNSPSYPESTQPLVDIRNDSFDDDFSGSSTRVDDQWKWSGPSSPTKVRSYDSRSNFHQLSAWPISPSVSPSETKLVTPVPIPLPSLNHYHLADRLLEDNFARTFSSFDSDILIKPSFDKVPLFDPFADDFAVDLNVVLGQEPAVQLVEVSEPLDLKEIAFRPFPLPHRHETSSSTPFDSTVDLDQDTTPPPSTPPRSEFSPQLSPHMTIFELEDENSNKISATLETCHDNNFEQPLVLMAAVVEYEIQEAFQQQEVVEKSPRGSLLPTALNDQVADEEVPELDLDSEIDSEDSIESKGAIFEDEDDATPKATPTSDNVDLLPEVETLFTTLEHSVDVADAQSAEYPDPDLLPLPEFISSKEDSPEFVAIAPLRLQMPTPPASPPSISPIRLSLISDSTSISPQITKALTPGEVKLNSTLLVRPVVTVSPPLYIGTYDDKDDGATPIAIVGTKPAWAGVPSEKVDVAAVSLEDEDSDVDEDSLTDEDALEEQSSELNEDATPEECLPGSFPELDSASSGSIQEKSVTTTIGARLASSSVPTFRPSARDIIRQPLEIALAMQLRPGLGAGADPAWMVRFLMAMFGWLAVVVSGQPEY